jgi:hypothetical protein
MGSRKGCRGNDAHSWGRFDNFEEKLSNLRCESGKKQDIFWIGEISNSAAD